MRTAILAMAELSPFSCCDRARKRQTCGHVETGVRLEHNIDRGAKRNSLWSQPCGFSHLYWRWQSNRPDQLRRAKVTLLSAVELWKNRLRRLRHFLPMPDGTRSAVTR